jgi:glutaredoxin
MPHFPDSNCSAVCPKTGKKFDFDTYYYEGNEDDWQHRGKQIYLKGTMTFPKGVGERSVEINCPYCKTERHLFHENELLWPVAVVEKDQQELHDMVKLEELDAKKSEAEARRAEAEAKKTEKQIDDRIKALERRLDEKDKLLTQRVGELAESYLTLAKFINLEVPKLIAEAKGNKGNYETAHS